VRGGVVSRAWHFLYFHAPPCPSPTDRLVVVASSFLPERIEIDAEHLTVLLGVLTAF
jgi:hypothetical protein